MKNTDRRTQSPNKERRTKEKEKKKPTGGRMTERLKRDTDKGRQRDQREKRHMKREQRVCYRDKDRRRLNAGMRSSRDRQATHKFTNPDPTTHQSKI